MANHLILLAANKVRPNVTGSIDLISDCLLGALDKVSSQPPNRIPTRDILKSIMVNCSELTFALNYLYVRAHQDDDADYHLLSRPSQLNCLVDLKAKETIWGLDGEELPPQEVFPLEPVAVFFVQEKMTSDTAECHQLWAHYE